MGVPPVVHFGGPDRPPRALRDLLQERVDAVPSGGEIIWSTYYFRDCELARALIRASDRGVRVCLHVEGRPRQKSVNEQVVDMLLTHGLNGGLHVHIPCFDAFSGIHPHLHSKIYFFSHPEPTVMVGSFNPSGDVPEDQEVVAEIGDQDRGHNLLVEFSEPGLADALRAHVLGLGRAALRFRPDQNRTVEGAQATAWFYPRVRTGIIDSHLDRVGSGATVRGAISHLKHGQLVSRLIGAAARGVSVRLLVHDTERRVPGSTIVALGRAGVNVIRYVHPERLPLHAKLLLIDEENTRAAYFGSFNYNPRSRYLNHELLMRSVEPALFHCLSARFEDMAQEAESYAGGQIQ